MYLRKRLERGMGLGHGTSYRPWLTVRDVPSSGTSSIVLGIKSARLHHLFSNLESTYFFMLERDPSIIDIREQFPILEIGETQRICRQLGVPHVYKKGFPDAFTIDFLVTRWAENGPIYEARSIKPAARLLDDAARRRLAVEWRWCQSKGIDWRLVDTTHFSKTLLSSLRFIREWFRRGCSFDVGLADAFAHEFDLAFGRYDDLASILERVAARLGRPFGAVDDVFRMASWLDRIDIDFTKTLALNRPVVRRSRGRHVI